MDDCQCTNMLLGGAYGGWWCPVHKDMKAPGYLIVAVKQLNDKIFKLEKAELDRKKTSRKPEPATDEPVLCSPENWPNLVFNLEEEVILPGGKVGVVKGINKARLKRYHVMTSETSGGMFAGFELKRSMDVEDMLRPTSK